MQEDSEQVRISLSAKYQQQLADRLDPIKSGTLECLRGKPGYESLFSSTKPVERSLHAPKPGPPEFVAHSISEVCVPDPLLSKCEHFDTANVRFTLDEDTGYGSSWRRKSTHVCSVCLPGGVKVFG